MIKYRPVALKTTQYAGVVYNRGDLFPQTWDEIPSVHPFTDSSLWEGLRIPDSAKMGIYTSDMDYDTGDVDSQGNPILANRLLPDAALISARVTEEKARLTQEVISSAESRAKALIVSDYPPAERDAFSEKLTAARTWSGMTTAAQDTEISAFELNPAAYNDDLDILLNEVTLTGTAAAKRAAVDALVTTITTNNRSWRQVIAKLTKERKAHQTAIAATASDEAGLDSLLAYSITWSI